MTRANNAPWFAKAGAATSILPISHFVGPRIFALKGGGYGCLFSLEGIDPESRTDEDLHVRVRSVEAALRGLPEGSCLYQYTRVISGFNLPRQDKYPSSVTESFARDRNEFLNQTARFRRIDLHWCLTIEPDTGSLLSRKPKEHKSATDRQLFELEKAATILETHMSDSIGLKLLDKEQAFQFFSYLFNLEEWASDVRLRSDAGVDRQIVHAPVEWHSEHLRIGRRYVQMFPLTNTPEISRPCLFTNPMELDCDSILCSVWRPQPDHATRREVSSQEKFLEFFKLSPFQRLMSGRNTAPLENTATAKAVAGNVDNLSEVVSSLDKLSQGDYALRLLLAANTAAGDVLHYVRGSKEHGIERGSYAQVVASDLNENLVTVRKENGEQVTYNPARLRGISAYREIEREFAIGDRIQLTAPNRELGVANRDFGTLQQIGEDGRLTVRMDGDNEKTITFDPREMRHFDHGYAVTSHSSQGLTSERVLVNMDTEVHPELISQRFAYVSVSRASHDAQIFTNDAATLAENLSRDVSKASAIQFGINKNPSANVELEQAAVVKTTPGIGLGLAL